MNTDPLKRFYPSGAPMPPYGPTTDDEQIIDALEWAHAMLYERDLMNAAVHCTSARLSPVTLKVATALSLFRIRTGLPDSSEPWQEAKRT